MVLKNLSFILIHEIFQPFHLIHFLLLIFHSTFMLELFNFQSYDINLRSAYSEIGNKDIIALNLGFAMLIAILSDTY